MHAGGGRGRVQRGGDGAGSVFDGVASLLDKSLLLQREQVQGEPRVEMLETLREYGLEAVEASGGMEVTRDAHAEYYPRLAEEAEPELAGQEQAVWLERLEQEHDNLRAALWWFLEQGEAGQSMEITRSRRFWEYHSHWSEGGTFLERALAGSKGVEGPVQMKVLKAAAHLASVRSDNDRAEALSEECLARCRELGDTAGIALSLRILGMIARNRCNFVVACSRTEESLALFRAVEDKEGTASALNNLANIVSQQGEYARAISLKEEALALFEELGNIEGMAFSRLGLADILFRSEGDPAKVHTLLEESLTL